MKFFTIYVKAFQSIYDLAVQQYGSVDHIDVLITDNPTLDLENDLAVGTQVKIRTEMSVLDEAALKYFTESGDQVATWENNGVSPGYDPGFSSCPVANITAKNTDDEILATGTAPSGGTGTLIIPDVEVIVNGVSQGNKVVKSPIIIIPTLIQYIRPPKSNYKVTWATGDEYWIELNDPDTYVPPAFGVPALLDPANPHKLLYNNAFGHKWRRTGVNGGYYDIDTSQYKLADGTVSDVATTFGIGADGYFIDHHTGLGYKYTSNGTNPFTSLVSTIQGLTCQGFSDFQLWSMPQLLSLWIMKQNNFLLGDSDYLPLSLNQTVRSCTPVPSLLGASHRGYYAGNTANSGVSSVHGGIAVRRHYT